MRALRFHRHEGEEFRRADVGSVCMHAGSLIGDQTTGSFVAVLARRQAHDDMDDWGVRTVHRGVQTGILRHPRRRARV